jgi:hypothetical protein
MLFLIIKIKDVLIKDICIYVFIVNLKNIHVYILYVRYKIIMFPNYFFVLDFGEENLSLCLPMPSLWP